MIASATATFDGIDIPRIFEMDREPIVIADITRTAGGKERMDVVAVKGRWSFRTRPIPATSAAVLWNHLGDVLWRYGDYWCDEFGDPSNTVRARMELRESRSYRLPTHRELTLTVIEQ